LLVVIAQHRRPALALLIAAATAILALALVLALTGGSGHSRGSAAQGVSAAGFAGAALPGGIRAPDFTLTDQAGRPTTLAGLRGQVAVLAFVSTSCGPPCVLIAQQIRGALDELAHPVPVLLISLDPVSDTPARIAHFLAQVSLSRRARYLTGPPGVLRSLWRAYGIAPPSAGRSAFERTAGVLVVDRAGRERVIFGLEQLTPEGLAHDVRSLS
jgi:protein SCO1/2